MRWNIIRTITYLKWDINYPLQRVNIKFLKNCLFWQSVGRPTLGEPIYNINNLRVQEIIFAIESVRNIPYARRIDSRVVNASAVPRLHGRNMFTELSGEMSATRISITGAGAGAGRGGVREYSEPGSWLVPHLCLSPGSAEGCRSRNSRRSSVVEAVGSPATRLLDRCAKCALRMQVSGLLRFIRYRA